MAGVEFHKARLGSCLVLQFQQRQAQPLPPGLLPQLSGTVRASFRRMMWVIWSFGGGSVLDRAGLQVVLGGLKPYHSVRVDGVAQLLPLTGREGYGYASQDVFSTRPPEAVLRENIEGLVSLTPAKDTPLRNHRLDCGTRPRIRPCSVPFSGQDLRVGRRTYSL